MIADCAVVFLIRLAFIAKSSKDIPPFTSLINSLTSFIFLTQSIGTETGKLNNEAVFFTILK